MLFLMTMHISAPLIYKRCISKIGVTCLCDINHDHDAMVTITTRAIGDYWAYSGTLKLLTFAVAC